MRIKSRLTIVLALIAGFGVIGLIETVGADPKGSQRLRGLEGRVFVVEVTPTANPFEIPGFEVGVPSTNYYCFGDDGIWGESNFPTFGPWYQDSNGAKTTYSVDAIFHDPVGDNLEVQQIGSVTPAGGKGVLQLTAVTLVLPGFFGEGTGLIEFFSEGYEVDESLDICD